MWYAGGAWAPAQEVPDPETLESPLPGGLASLVRFFLDFPQSLQIAGVVVAVLVAGAVGFVAWRRRAGILRWLTTRPRVVYAWAVGVAVFLALIGAGAGAWGWHYVQHDNGFCTGCHVMGPSFVRFTESEHSQLECHDCHQQPVSASMRQLYLWVLERPQEIGEHAPVATEVCARCHIQDDPGETWEAIVGTRGHALHLTSEDPALSDVQCVTCHGQEVHRFAPAETTCGQSSCHAPEETRVALGTMAGEQTSFHCLTCHEFAAPIARASGEALPVGLVPSIESCGACHAMEPLVAEIASVDDPHESVCGMCHNPHDQTLPEDASSTCTSAGCHADPLSLTAFHRGLRPGVAAECLTCHPAHGWAVDGDDCTACHTEPAFERGSSPGERE